MPIVGWIEATSVCERRRHAGRPTATVLRTWCISLMLWIRTFLSNAEIFRNVDKAIQIEKYDYNKTN